MKGIILAACLAVALAIPYHEAGYTYESCMSLSSYYNIYWNYLDNQVVNITFEAATNSWVGLGFADVNYPGQMVPLGIDGLDIGLHHDGVVGYLDLQQTPRVLDVRLRGKFYGPDGVYPDADLPNGVNDLRGTALVREQALDEVGKPFTRTMATFVRDFNTGDDNDIPLVVGQPILYAMGPPDDDGLIDDVLLQHGDANGDERYSGSITINFAENQGCNGIDLEKQLEEGVAVPIGCSGSRGRCVGCRCVCEEPWIGEFCERSSICPGDPPCNGRGECLNGLCLCTENWAGPACDEEIDPNKIIGQKDNGAATLVPSLLLALAALFF